MPAGLVKTKKDEERWGVAKKSCSKYREGEKGGSRYWRCVTGTFMRIKRNASRGKR